MSNCTTFPAYHSLSSGQSTRRCRPTSSPAPASTLAGVAVTAAFAGLWRTGDAGGNSAKDLLLVAALAVAAGRCGLASLVVALKKADVRLAVRGEDLATGAGQGVILAVGLLAGVAFLRGLAAS